MSKFIYPDSQSAIHDANRNFIDHIERPALKLAGIGLGDVVFVCDGGHTPLVSEGMWRVTAMDSSEYPMKLTHLNGEGYQETTPERCSLVMDHVHIDHGEEIAESEAALKAAMTLADTALATADRLMKERDKYAARVAELEERFH